MKKGVSHIDWVVSMGLFIVYVLILFIFIKPGYRPIDEGKILLKIVENDFRDGFYWDIDKIPLFIRVSDNQYSSPGCKKSGPGSEYNDNLEIADFPFNWNNNNFFMKNEDQTKLIKSNLKGEATKYLDFRADSIQAGTNKYWLFYNKAEAYGSEFLKEEVCGTPGKPSCNTEDCFDYILGVNERLGGIKPIDRLSVLKYLDYPSTREFSITIYNKDGSTAYSYSTAGEPPINVNVYVKQWSDWILNKDGTNMPVTVNIRAW
ncbi:MAG: hypothetical protein AB1571_01830 [Nanoarchaeota archaeon]